MFKITQQTQADSQVVEALMTEAFGLNRYDRSVWALRPGEPVAALCLVGYDDDQAVGSLRFWEVMLNNEIILLLGPLAVQPHVRGKGFGQQLVQEGMRLARLGPWRLVLVSGEPDYYPKFGFVPAVDYGLAWPGFVEPERLQFCELVPGALANLPPSGLVVRGVTPPA
ncbi:N-acetyltransferase [Alphaproteobacteria bacterium]|nr:N-acetyltransferase [Alphaproteobacteria bacterium]